MELLLYHLIRTRCAPSILTILTTHYTRAAGERRMREEGPVGGREGEHSTNQHPRRGIPTARGVRGMRGRAMARAGTATTPLWSSEPQQSRAWNPSNTLHFGPLETEPGPQHSEGLKCRARLENRLL